MTKKKKSVEIPGEPEITSDVPEGVEEAMQEAPGVHRPAAVEQEEEIQQADASVQADFCPVCGNHVSQGAIQLRLPIGPGEPIPLPLVVCVTCSACFMPRSVLTHILQPQEEPMVKVAKPRIKLPSEM